MYNMSESLFIDDDAKHLGKDDFKWKSPCSYYLPSKVDAIFDKNISNRGVYSNSEIMEYRSLYKNMINSFTANEVDLFLKKIPLTFNNGGKEGYWKYLTNPKFNPEWLQADTNKVFYDLEVNNFPDKSLDNPKLKQSMSIAVSIDDMGEVNYWNPGSTEDLLSYLLEYDEVVSFNGLNHDNLILYSSGFNDRLIYELYNKSFDMMYYYNSYMNKFNKLDSFSEKYLFKKGHIFKNKIDKISTNTVETFKNGNREEKAYLWKYCFVDVHLLRDLYFVSNITLDEKYKLFLYYYNRVENIIYDVRREILLNK